MQSISYQLWLFIYLYVHLWMSSTEQQGETQHIQQKCILPLKDRKTRGAEAGGREDKGLLWTETAENTDTRRVPSTKVPAPCMITLSKDPQEIYSVLRGKGGRGWGSTDTFMIEISQNYSLIFLLNGRKWELVIETDDKSQFECNLDKYLHTS